MTELDYQRANQTKFSSLEALQDPHAILAAELGPAFVEYRRRWDAAERFELELDYPLHVDLETSFRCNLRCPMCVLSLSPAEQAAWGDRDVKMTQETATQVIDEGVRHGQASLGLNGVNEPLLTPYLPELVRHARERGIIDVMLNTNGVLLDEERSRALITAGLTRIMISLDALNKHTYDKIRVGSDFDRVMRNIDRLLEIRAELGGRLPLVRVSFVRMSLNEGEIDAFVEHWSRKVDFLSMQQYANPFEGSQRDGKEALRARTISFGYADGFSCPQPWTRATVRNTGEVLPCCAWHGMRLGMGNVHERPLKEIWNDPRWQALRKVHREGRYAETEACRLCASSFVGRYDVEIPGQSPK